MICFARDSLTMKEAKLEKISVVTWFCYLLYTKYRAKPCCRFTDFPIPVDRMGALEKCAIRLWFSALMHLFAKWELSWLHLPLLRMSPVEVMGRTVHSHPASGSPRKDFLSPLLQGTHLYFCFMSPWMAQVQLWKQNWGEIQDSRSSLPSLWTACGQFSSLKPRCNLWLAFIPSSSEHPFGNRQQSYMVYRETRRK